MNDPKKIQVTVHYAPAAKPFSKAAEPTETVGALLDEALNAFGITPDPAHYTYVLYNGTTPLSNPAETLESVAGGKHELQLKLSKELVQG